MATSPAWQNGETSVIVGVRSMLGSSAWMAGHLPVHVWLPFGILGVISWTVWVLRRALTSRYRPIVTEHYEEASVVSPVFSEDPQILKAAVKSWLGAGAAEVLLIVPHGEAAVHAEAWRTFDERVRVLLSPSHDKRENLALGIRRATHSIVVLSDSDTVWEPDLLRQIVMPFDDPGIGGVGSRQRVLDADGSVWRRAAEWMLDAKYLVYLPAMSRRGGVSCLSGRTVAYRRDVIVPLLPDLVDERFLGRRCVAGDDGRLTWLVLNAGYRTVYQTTALAWTMMPDTVSGFMRQRVRWARNSYRCYLRAVAHGWLFHQPWITRVSVLQGLLSPLSLTVGLALVTLSAARGDVLGAAIWACWVTCGRGLRAFDHLRRNPRNLLLLPFMAFMIVIVMTALKYYALVTMNRQAWITRSEERGVAAGQGFATLRAPLAVRPAADGDG